MKKKSLFIIAALAVAALVSCNKEPAESVSTYELKSGKTELVGFSAEVPASLSVYAETVDDGVADDLEIALKADFSLVDAYNATASAPAAALPESAFSFADTKAKIRANYRKSNDVAINLIYSADLQPQTVYVLPVVIESISGSRNAVAKEGGVVFFKITTAKTDAGNGTEASPYLIRTVEDLEAMGDLVISGQTVWFKLMNDIDLSTSEMPIWIPFNTADPYKNYVNFNGQGHTIKNLSCVGMRYASFMGIVAGEVYDVTFENATIEGSSAVGILGGYIGTTGVEAYVHDVHVSGKVNGTNDNGVGGLCGRIANSTVERCSVDAEVTCKGNYCGGIYGYENSENNVVIKDCCTSGVINSGQRCGGIAGGMIKSGTKIVNCYTTMAINGPFAIGGIAGHCCLDMKGDANGGKLAAYCHAKNTMEGCIAWNDGVHTPGTDKDTNYSSGAVVGYTAIFNNFKNCWRKPDATCYTWGADKNILADHADMSESSPLAYSCDPDTEYVFSYHGKAANAGESCSDVAKRIGWSTSVWDLSGALPKLIKK